jgi:hypothetical protein
MAPLHNSWQNQSLARAQSFSNGKNRKALPEYIAVSAMFIIFLLINFVSASGFMFGSVHDESMRSLSFEVV